MNMKGSQFVSAALNSTIICMLILQFYFNVNNSTLILLARRLYMALFPSLYYISNTGLVQVAQMEVDSAFYLLSKDD